MRCRTSAPPINKVHPAPAGNTRPRRWQGTRTPVHPRACGEHPSMFEKSPPTSGSSPRLRGTRAGAAAAQPGHRFIPAPAGNTWPSPTPPSPGAVHPRACGEHSGSSWAALLTVGSCPRLRGTRHRAMAADRPGRFIPAPAGNTRWGAAGSEHRTVHPRACGEHLSSQTWQGAVAGSSPRLRGTPAQRHYRRADQRFIPAPAGNTCAGERH